MAKFIPVTGFVNDEGDLSPELNYINTVQIVSIYENKEYDVLMFEMSNKMVYYSRYPLEDFIEMFSD